MKFVTRKGPTSKVPYNLKDYSTPCFSLFSKVKSKYGPDNSPVYLNVYDLTPINGYAYWAGVGIFHSGVEEYAFGAHDYPTSGVFEVEPRQCPGFKFRRSILIGTTCLDPVQVREFMEHHAANYFGDTYHLIVKNCNHFCNDICYNLTGKRIPGWVNRLAKLGSIFSCVLPEALRVSAVQHDPQFIPYENEKQKLRSSNSFGFLSSRQRQLSVSSLLLQSPLKGCLRPWELKRSRTVVLNDR
ncbi:deSI-like protein At4g17486 isoform X2 [Rutidosis leptorrhynchoides]|uniref:deSI-like protein At4g17486 isoform X2 n=1 Tax=Rutidosis leptorrhynchoides TaxID=125765 RepID=UPI003A99A9C7